MSKILKIVECRLNMFVCSSTKYSPLKLRLKTNPFDLLHKDEYETVIKQAKENQLRTNFKANILINKKRKENLYKEGDQVLLKSFEQGKLERNFIGLYNIMKKSESGNRLLKKKEKIN